MAHGLDVGGSLRDDIHALLWPSSRCLDAYNGSNGGVISVDKVRRRHQNTHKIPSFRRHRCIPITIIITTAAAVANDNNYTFGRGRARMVLNDQLARLKFKSSTPPLPSSPPPRINDADYGLRRRWWWQRRWCRIVLLLLLLFYCY